MRKQKEVLELEEEFFDRVWYERHLIGVSSGNLQKSPLEIRKGAKEAAKRIRKKYSEKYGKGWFKLDPKNSDFDYGYINGHLAALRWVLGEEMDFLDT